MTKICLSLAAVAALTCSQAQAWGDLGHEVTALVAYRHLSPTARAAMDTLLASDSDSLTSPDFAGRSTWADKYRNAHRETAAWHFVDIEIDQPNLGDACFGFPALPAGQPASAGPAQDCVVNKIDEFAIELKSPSTSPAERLLALKFLIHFIGDLHQPLHAADHHDRGGNCIGLSPPMGAEINLHAYWDVTVVEALGHSATHIADQLDARLSADDIKAWSQGTPRSWAMDTFEVGRRDAYALPSQPTCQSGGSVTLPPAYLAQAEKDAVMQLLKAAVRLSAVLNQALGASSGRFR
ncbi:MAG TPA: S1/P1 nuclease [Steroidobacteraceae bacterium]|nr:S1/P1 nuclease [Steroidobacteraceae bacterium]